MLVYPMLLIATALLSLSLAFAWRWHSDRETLREHLFLLEVDDRYRRLHLAEQAARDGGAEHSALRARRVQRLLDHLHGCGLISEGRYAQGLSTLNARSYT